MIAAIVIGACVTTRQGGYLLRLGVGLLLIGLACGAAWLNRVYPHGWAGLWMIVLAMVGFVLIHWAMAQFLGRGGLGIVEWVATPATPLCCLIYVSGFQGAALSLSHATVAFLVVDTATVYWSYRKEVPYLMPGLTFLAAGTAMLFGMRAFAIASALEWRVATPDNWAENLTSVLAVPFVTTLGPLILALYHFRDRVALMSQAATDALTGLRNRRALLDEFEDHPFSFGAAIAMFDLDHFKRTNDVFGHQIGDDVLKRFAYVVGRHCANDAKGYRLGGEEFALVVTRGGEAKAAELAGRICVAFGAEVVATPLGPLRSTVSAGVAAGNPSAGDLRSVIALADAALYAAKREGRNRVRTHSQSLLPENRLAEAIRVA